MGGGGAALAVKMTNMHDVVGGGGRRERERGTLGEMYPSLCWCTKWCILINPSVGKTPLFTFSISFSLILESEIQRSSGDCSQVRVGGWGEVGRVGERWGVWGGEGSGRGGVWGGEDGWRGGER